MMPIGNDKEKNKCCKRKINNTNNNTDSVVSLAGQVVVDTFLCSGPLLKLRCYIIK